MQWLLLRAGLKSQAAKCKDLRKELPWLVVQEALTTPRDYGECEDCGEEHPFEDLPDGRCEDCDSKYVYCSICHDDVHTDGLCDHLSWSDAAGDEVGTGSDSTHDKEFDLFLTKLGRRRVKKLREEIANGTWRTCESDRSLSEAVNRIGELARDADSLVEVGWIWLDTLSCSDQRLKKHVKQTLGWIDAHLTARAAENAADRRPRRIVRDGGRRYFVDGEWTAIREHGAWMHPRRAHQIARKLRAAYPAAVIRVVHVLTPHQTRGPR
jgi:RNA polymerase-binding transcription factor DksA